MTETTQSWPKITAGHAAAEAAKAAHSEAWEGAKSRVHKLLNKIHIGNNPDKHGISQAYDMAALLLGLKQAEEELEQARQAWVARLNQERQARGLWVVEGSTD
jgi:hypothetical protein